MSNFRVGQRVVCVDDRFRGAKSALIHRGHIYTVLALYGDQTGDTSVITVDCTPSRGGSRGWDHWRFRPAVEKPCDISIFTKMLTPDREMV